MQTMAHNSSDKSYRRVSMFQSNQMPSFNAERDSNSDMLKLQGILKNAQASDFLDNEEADRDSFMTI